MAMDIAAIDWSAPDLKVKRCSRGSEIEVVFSIQHEVWQTSMQPRLEGELEIFRNHANRMSY